MRTNSEQNRLTVARRKFEPVARVLDHLSKEIGKEHAARLKQGGEMQQTAQNAYQVRYSLRLPDEARLSLTFVMVGEDADLMLVQTNQGSRDVRANPGQVDQRVYRLDEIDEIKQAVQEKITAHLRVEEVRH